MADTKTIGVKDLKNNLSAYLREVRRGTRVLVTDRNVVVAELHEPGATYLPDDLEDPTISDWVREGTVILPTRKREPLPPSSVRVPAGTSRRWLEDAREEGRE